MKITLKIFSKNPRSLKKFYDVLENLTDLKNFRTNFKTISKNKKTQKKRITVIKSPHVNKKAQETYEYRTQIKILGLKIFQITEFVIELKKLKTHLLSDIYVKINIESNNAILDNLLKEPLLNNSLRSKTRNKLDLTKLKVLKQYGKYLISETFG